jgi:hypothetical protein
VTLSLAVAIRCLLGVPALAQEHAHGMNGSNRATISLGGMAVLVATQVDPAVRSTTLREMYLSQPMIMLHARTPNDRLSAHVTLNAEGALMRRGELTPGIYGEGYVDRRHPHTALHEVMLVAQRPFGGAALSLGVGKGFVPFGSDDPMMRPFQKFPVNHHIAQILERAMVTAAARYGMLRLEGSLFNGDEPESPGDLPNLDRIGDSWSARATLTPVPSLEASLSTARVASPEDAGGKGLNQRKVHASVRYGRPAARGVQYALVEYGNTGEYRRIHKAWDFASALAEVGGAFGPTRVALRYERTTRPDEERTGGDFRSFRPLLDFSILGRSQWDAATLNISTPRRLGANLAIDPFIEASLSRVRPTVLPTTFVPLDFYGASRLWSLSAGMRLHAGQISARMGRYGAARPAIDP